MSQDDWKFTAPIDLPETVKAIILKPMLVDGIYGLGCSPDNGVTNRVYWTIYGRKYYQEDADRLWPLLIDKVKSVMSIDWDNIQNKPKFVTTDELEARLDKLSVPTVKWADIEDKPPIPSIDGLVKETELADYAKKSEMPNVDGLAKQSDLDNVKATADSATSKAEQAQSTADANTKALQNVYTKEEADRKYWTAEQEQNASNVKSVNNIEPDDRGNVDIDLTGYAKTSDIPKTMGWSQIIGKPNLALTSDIPSLDGYAKLTDIPSVTGLVKETELADYAKKSDIPKMPDLSGYATVANLIDYAKKTDLPDFSQFVKKSEIPELPDTSNFANRADLDKVKATLNSNIDAAKVSYEQIYPTLINGTTGSVNAFLITLSEKVKMLAFWANVTLPTIPGWSQVDIMSFPQMYEQNHITLNQSVIPDNYHSLWADYSSTNFSLRNQTGATVSNYSFNFFGSGIFLY